MSAIQLVLRNLLHYRYGVLRPARNLVLGLIVMFSSLIIGERVSAEPITIVAVGDSLVHGYGLMPEDGFVPQLQSVLVKAGHDVNILNAGVSGDTTAGGAARVAWALTDDVQAMIVSLGANDVLRGLDPALAQENLRQILTTARERELPIMLVGISAPFNFGEEYKFAFEAIYPALSKEFETILYPNFLNALSVLPDRAATLQNLMQADAIHPNADGVALIVNDMLPTVESLIREVENQPEG